MTWIDLSCYNSCNPSLGSPLDLGDPRQHAWKWPISPKMFIFKHVGNGQNVTQELISLHQTIKGDPNDGLDELEPDRSYLNHFPTWCAKCIHSYLFPCRFFLIKWANHISVDRTDINWDKNLKLFLGGGALTSRHNIYFIMSPTFEILVIEEHPTLHGRLQRQLGKPGLASFSHSRTRISLPILGCGASIRCELSPPPTVWV